MQISLNLQVVCDMRAIFTILKLPIHEQKLPIHEHWKYFHHLVSPFVFHCLKFLITPMSCTYSKQMLRVQFMLAQLHLNMKILTNRNIIHCIKVQNEMFVVIFKESDISVKLANMGDMLLSSGEYTEENRCSKLCFPRHKIRNLKNNGEMQPQCGFEIIWRMFF